MMAQWVKAIVSFVFGVLGLLYAMSGSLTFIFLVGSQYPDYLAHRDLY